MSEGDSPTAPSPADPSCVRSQSDNGLRPSLVNEILSYLQEHPEAQDTLEGIMVWWLSERAIKRWLPQVRASLAVLVASGELEERTGADGRVVYRLSLPRVPTRERFTEMKGGARR